MQLFTAEGILFLLRWIHFLAGITWIGLLYYFNLVQVPFFAETEPAVRSGAIQKLVPRALWWFRWGAMFTFFSGWLVILHRMSVTGLSGFFDSSYGWAITTGGILGTFMWANVWFVIWPNQKVVIASAVQVAGGGQAIPDAPARGRRGFLASRTNFVFSIPMLFFMGAASHLSLFAGAPAGAKAAMALIGILLILAIEANALTGATGPAKKPLETVRSAITFGLVLTVVFVLLFALLF